MGWLYVPGLRVSNSDSSSPSEIPIAPSVTWKGRPLRLSYWPAVWKKAVSKWRLAARGVESWIFSARAFLASQSLALGSDKPKKTSDGSGLTSLASFARYDRESSCWRTYQGSLFADSETFSESWPPSGSMRSGCVFEHRSLEHRTFGAAFSSWPGVSATRYGSSQNEGKVQHDRPSQGTPSLDTLARLWPTPRAEDAESCGNHPGRQDSLNATARIWPTPQAHDAHPTRNVPNGNGLETEAKRWRTPTAAIRRGPVDPEARKARGHMINLQDQAVLGFGRQDRTKTGAESKRVLNPRFVEWLMGFPFGWTELLPLEMESFQSWRRKHSSLLRSVL